MDENDTSLLEDFVADTDMAYDLIDQDALSDDLYDYYDSFKEEDDDDDDGYDEEEDDHDSSLDKYDLTLLKKG